MPNFTEGSRGYKLNASGLNFGEGTGGMGGVHKLNLENEKLKAEIGDKPIDHLPNATPEEQAHNDAADKSEGSIEKQAKREARYNKKNR